MDWIKGRLKEPSSYLAVAVGGVGLGILFGSPLFTWAGIICGIGKTHGKTSKRLYHFSELSKTAQSKARPKKKKK